MLGAILGAAASIGGSLLGQKSAEKAAEKQNAANAAIQRKEYERQKEFAQSGIQWKVQDATKAGIHPLYAMGAQTSSYSPTSIGATGTSGSDFGIPDAGQNIGRAIDATRTTPEQQMALALTSKQIESVSLDNDIKRTQLASSIALALQNQQRGIPAIGDVNFVDGQGDSGVVSSVPPGHEARLPQYTNPDLMLWGKRWERRPGTSDAQSWEDVYGDESLIPFIVNNLSGIGDAWHNSSRAYNNNVIQKLRR